MYYVYILQIEKDGRYYIGSTSNIEERLKFHNAGLQRSTKHRIPFKLIHSEILPDKSAALKREKEIKAYKGGNSFRKLIQGM